jgi:hypothetical protein
MKQFKILVDHGILFVNDPSDAEMSVPDYDPDSIISVNESCISIACRPSVDGDVKISLLDTIDQADLGYSSLVFDGYMRCAENEIALFTPEDEIVSVSVNGHSARIRIWCETLRSPANISLLIGDE